jgi:hypothetical protein
MLADLLKLRASAPHVSLRVNDDPPAVGRAEAQERACRERRFGGSCTEFCFAPVFAPI